MSPLRTNRPRRDVMVFVALLLGIPNPVPMLSADAVRQADGSVRLFWVVPPDPSIVGVTLLRYRYGDNDLVIFNLIGLSNGYHDVSARAHVSYDYWVHTRDGTGLESIGVVVTSYALLNDYHTHVDCDAAIQGGGVGTPFGAGGVILAVMLFMRRRTTNPKFETRNPK